MKRHSWTLALLTSISFSIAPAIYAQSVIYGGIGLGADLFQPKRDVDVFANPISLAPNSFLHSRDGTFGGIGRLFIGFKQANDQYGLAAELGGQVGSAETEAKVDNFANINGLTAIARIKQKTAFDFSLLPSVCVFNSDTDAFFRLGYRKTQVTAESEGDTGGNLIATGSDTQWIGGYIAGLGLETSITPTISARFEYIFSQVQSMSSTSLLTPALGGNDDTVHSTINPQDHAIMLNIVFSNILDASPAPVSKVYK